MWMATPPQDLPAPAPARVRRVRNNKVERVQMGPRRPGPLGQACKIRLKNSPLLSNLLRVLCDSFPFTRATKVLKGTAWARAVGALFRGQLARQSPWAA